MKTKAMFYSISTLLTRNLHDVFGENDPARRRTSIDEIFTEDCVFYDPKGGVYRGRDEIDRIAGAFKATHPDFRYQPIAQPEEAGNGGRIQWVSGRPSSTRLRVALPLSITALCGEESRQPGLITIRRPAPRRPQFLSDPLTWPETQERVKALFKRGLQQDGEFEKAWPAVL